MTTEVSSPFLGLPIEIIYQVLDKLDKLQILYSLCNVSPRLNMIIGTYYRFKTFTVLNRKWKRIEYKELKQLVNAFQIIPTLVTLDLTGNQLGARETQCLADALKTNTTLTTLHLGSNDIGSSGAFHLSCALQKNKTLTTLHLGSNDIGSSGAFYLSSALQKNKTLTTLHLESNQIGSEGAQYLADELENNKINNMVVSTLESLPNEILLGILQIPKSHDLLSTWYNLNSHFNKVIQRLCSWNLSNTTYSNFLRCLSLLTNHQDQVFSLKLSNAETTGRISSFFRMLPFDNFHNLRSLSIIEVNQIELNNLVLKLPTLNHLLYLYIYCGYTYYPIFLLNDIIAASLCSFTFNCISIVRYNWSSIGHLCPNFKYLNINTYIYFEQFVDFDDGILYTTTYMKRELTLSCGRNMLSLLPGVSNRYDHLETLALNFSTDFQWSAEALSLFVFPNVCHLSLSFPEDYYEYDRHGLRCGFVHNQLKPDEYQSIFIFLNKILRLSKLQSLAIYSLLPKDYLIQLLSSTTNLTKLPLHGWAGSIKVDLFDFMLENRQLFKNIQHLIITDRRKGIIDIKKVENFIRIFDDYRLLKVLEIEANDKYSFPVLRLLLNKIKSLSFISIKSYIITCEVPALLKRLKEVLNGIEYQANVEKDVLSIWF
ncbi:unnamed protein product [Rotaria magnacalcarata]